MTSKKDPTAIKDTPEAWLQTATSLIETNGNTFHSKVIDYFKSNGWNVNISPYYLDQMQNKAREIDLIATKVFKIGYSNKSNGHLYLAIRLLIECKFIPTPTVVWMFNKDMERAKNVIKLAGLFRPEHSFFMEHHYLSTNKKVGKLFASSRPPSSSEENEPIYKALNQILSAYTALDLSPTNYVFSKLDNGVNPRVYKSITFPIVILNSLEKVFSVFEEAPRTPVPIQGNFQLEVDYAYIKNEIKVSRSFLIDFIDFNKISDFISVMDRTGEEAALEIPLDY